MLVNYPGRNGDKEYPTLCGLAFTTHYYQADREYCNGLLEHLDKLLEQYPYEKKHLWEKFNDVQRS